MTQLFSNELQRLSQRTEGAFANDDAAALEHPKERPLVVVANPARNAVYVGTTGDAGLTVIPL
jgi:hypothetical protein